MRTVKHYGAEDVTADFHKEFDLVLASLDKEWASKYAGQSASMAVLAMHIKRLSWTVSVLGVCVALLALRLVLR